MTALAMLAEVASVSTHTDQAFTLPQIIMMLTLVATLVAIVGGVVTLWINARKVRRENEADAQVRTDRIIEQMRTSDGVISDRLTKLETKSQDFMPKAEILGAIEHLKLSRQQIEIDHRERINGTARDVTDLRVSFGKLEQKQDGLASDMGEIKSMVKEQGRDTASRFDKLQDCLTSISRKVG